MVFRSLKLFQSSYTLYSPQKKQNKQRGILRENRKRLSARAVALHYGLPQNVVYKAISSGKLKAAQVKTENGVRAYILPQDAEKWFSSLLKNFESLEDAQ